MAQAYLWQQRFAPPVQTSSVRFQKKVQFNPKCPEANGCALGAVTNVVIDSSAVVTLSSTYKMQGLDCFQFKVTDVISNSNYTFRMKNTSNGSYPSGANSFGGLCVVSVSPIINSYACSTCNLVYTSIPPSVPFALKTTSNSITWTAPITPENYGLATIRSYTISNLQNISAPPSSFVRTWTSIGMSITGEYQALGTSNGYIWSSSDYGNTWNNTFNTTPARLIQGIAFTAVGYVYAVTSNGYIYVSPDYGITWIDDPEYMNDKICTGVSAIDNFTIYTFASGDVLVNQQYVYLPCQTNNISANSSCISVEPIYGNVVDASGSIYISEMNDIINWRTAFTIPSKASLTSIASSYNGSYQTAVAVDGTICRSANAGADWSVASNVNVALSSVKMTASGDIQIAVGSNVVFRSENYGETWRPYYVRGASNLFGVAVSFSDTFETFIEKPGNIWGPTTFTQTVSVTDPSLTIIGSQYSLSLLAYTTSGAVVRASNLAGEGPWSRSR